MVDQARAEVEAALEAGDLEAAKGPAPAQRKDVLAEMKTQIETLQDKYETHVFAGEKEEGHPDDTKRLGKLLRHLNIDGGKFTQVHGTGHTTRKIADDKAAE